MKVTLCAELNSAQLDFLRRFVRENNDIKFILMVEQTTTPITGEILQAVATQLGKTAIQVAQVASEYDINTVEEALAHESVPSEIKGILEGYL